jgi:hypothetical protein
MYMQVIYAGIWYVCSSDVGTKQRNNCCRDSRKCTIVIHTQNRDINGKTKNPVTRQL